MYSTFSYVMNILLFHLLFLEATPQKKLQSDIIILNCNSFFVTVLMLFMLTLGLNITFFIYNGVYFSDTAYPLAVSY